MHDNIGKAIADYKSGLSIKESGKLNGIPATTLRRHLRNNNVQIRKYTNKSKIINELAESKVGNWIVKSPVVWKNGQKENRVMWVCQCCSCGHECKIRQTWLLQGRDKNCWQCFRVGAGNHRWIGCGNLSGTQWKRIKHNAKRQSRTLPFTISIEYGWKLYEKQNGKCALTGLDIPFPQKVEDGNFPSLDRIDSNKGYIKGNVQWVHKDVNRMKWNLDQERFLNLCKLITENKEV